MLEKNSTFDGKIALVTGAGIRLGRHIAVALAQRGCDLVLHCRKSTDETSEVAREIKKMGRRAHVIRADFSKPGQAHTLARSAEEIYGRIDILVNSAAIFRPTPLEKINERELKAFLDINLSAPYVLSTEIGRRMKKRGNGVIVNMACLSAMKPWKLYIPYSISKAGVVALTVGLAKILGPEVRVNAVAPGTVLPPTNMDRSELRRLASRLPLKRLGCPEDVVLSVLYLCEAVFVTGQVLYVDGGRSVE